MTHVHTRASTVNRLFLTEHAWPKNEHDGPTMDELLLRGALVEMVEMAKMVEMVGMLSENVGPPKRELEPPTAHSIPRFKVTACPSCPPLPPSGSSSTTFTDLIDILKLYFWEMLNFACCCQFGW